MGVHERHRGSLDGFGDLNEWVTLVPKIAFDFVEELCGFLA
jgi:hypothetical protein